MPTALRTIGITIACAVVILAANASIYANVQSTASETSHHQEAQQPSGVVRIVVYQNS